MAFGYPTRYLFITHDKLIPKPILFSTNNSFIIIFMIRNSTNYSEYNIQRSTSEFWDELSNYMAYDYF